MERSLIFIVPFTSSTIRRQNWAEKHDLGPGGNIKSRHPKMVASFMDLFKFCDGRMVTLLTNQDMDAFIELI
ncbi:hypothetical protein O9992_25625 [Vibrio lentus]|nr:hypothetical protein [Vibrio lentus]